jgi:protein arginine N-methyltransferase 2
LRCLEKGAKVFADLSEINRTKQQLDGSNRSIHSTIVISRVMEGNTTEETDPDLQVQLILLAASHHNLSSLRPLLRIGSASVQDSETGFTPLHAAIAACDANPDISKTSQEDPTEAAISSGQTNGHTNGVSGGEEESDLEAAVKTVRLLLQNGAIWNDVDNNDETPGCLALRLGLQELYDIMVDAGVRAEMLLSRLDEYEQLGDQGDEEEEEDEEANDGNEAVTKGKEEGRVDAEEERVNGHTPNEQHTIGLIQNDDLDNEDYLQSSLRFQDGRILDSDNNGVMMAWETDIMKRTAHLLAPRSDLRILNIGHGMGIIDTFLQEKTPATHHIIEPHPVVLARMRQDGWYEKAHITIHEGKWQDVVPRIMEQGILFDAIYFDTFAEDYKALRDFFSDCIIGLLDDGGKWGFFNGMGADRQICYDVYGKIVEMDLFEAGFDTVWENIEVPEMNKEEWEGVKRRYWALKVYKLPICEFIG